MIAKLRKRRGQPWDMRLNTFGVWNGSAGASSSHERGCDSGRRQKGVRTFTALTPGPSPKGRGGRFFGGPYRGLAPPATFRRPSGAKNRKFKQVSAGGAGAAY